MSKDTLYNSNYTSPTSISDELYSSVGSSAFILGTIQRYFKGSTDLIIRTASGGGGTLLVETTDYTLTLNSSLTTEAGFNVYESITITNATYQSVDLYISYKVVGSLDSADIINTLLQSLNPVGAIFTYANDSVPTGYLHCDGSAISRTTYSALFSAIGTTWGVGDGSTTFNIPDLRGAFLRGSGTHGSETMADTNAFAGPALGAFENDSFQSFGFGSGDTVGGTIKNIGEATCLSLCGMSHTLDSYRTTFGSGPDIIASDGTNGTPRTGDETRPFNAGVKYIIKAV